MKSVVRRSTVAVAVAVAAAVAAGLLSACAGGTGVASGDRQPGAAARVVRPKGDASLVFPAAPAAPVAPPCVPDPSLGQPAAPTPPDLGAALDRFLADPRVAPHAVTLSVWVDGLGEVLAHEPDLALAPASNEKLFTAMGALAVLGPDAVLTSELRLTPAGDLAVVGGGDATLTITGPHSVDALAEQAQAHGLTTVSGALLVDETRYDGLARAAAWQDWQIPTYTGPLSAFMVDRNRWRVDPEFVASPALANAELVRAALARRGIHVLGPTVDATAPTTGSPAAVLSSPPVRDLVRDMLQVSDNQIADLLLKEVGRVGVSEGSLPAGARATTQALTDLCVPLHGTVDDGSGLSRGNARSAREWRSLLQAARTMPWWPLLADSLPIGGRTGTLAGRFHGTAAEGDVRAKTGTIIGGTALSGYATAASGRAVVFSVVVNGPGAEAAAGAIDGLVAAVCTSAA